MTIRRVALAAALSLVAVAPSAAGARQTPPRVQTQQYLHPHGVDARHWTVSTEETTEPIVFTPRPGDRVVRLAADDASGQPVFMHVRQDAQGNGDDLFAHTCATVTVVELVSERPIEVFLFNGFCRNHTSGFATTGSLTATFARRV
jgi:hypothetical protein